jgi:hypothetical protein
MDGHKHTRRRKVHFTGWSYQAITSQQALLKRRRPFLLYKSMEEAVSPPDATNHPVVIVEEDLPEDCDNEWLRTTPKPKPKLFSYDWAKGTSPIPSLLVRQTLILYVF